MINHIEKAESRLLDQYKESFNLINYIKGLLTEADNIEEIFRQLIEDRTLDISQGRNLNIIGNIVGQQRFNLNDDDYREVIRMRVILNTTIIDRESLIYALKFIFGQEKQIELIESHCEVEIKVSGQVPTNLQFYLDQKLLPKPIGLRYIVSFDDGKIFGYDGQDPSFSDNYGYGDLDDIAVGGAFIKNQEIDYEDEAEFSYDDLNNENTGYDNGRFRKK